MRKNLRSSGLDATYGELVTRPAFAGQTSVDPGGSMCSSLVLQHLGDLLMRLSPHSRHLHSKAH